MVKALLDLARSLYPFIEVIILAFLMGIGFQSSATGIVVLIVLFVLVYLWPKITRPIAWAIAIFIYLNANSPNNFFTQLVIALAIGVLRYLIGAVKK